MRILLQKIWNRFYPILKFVNEYHNGIKTIAWMVGGVFAALFAGWALFFSGGKEFEAVKPTMIKSDRSPDESKVPGVITPEKLEEQRNKSRDSGPVPVSSGKPAPLPNIFGFGNSKKVVGDVPAGGYKLPEPYIEYDSDGKGHIVVPPGSDPEAVQNLQNLLDTLNRRTTEPKLSQDPYDHRDLQDSLKGYVERKKQAPPTD